MNRSRSLIALVAVVIVAASCGGRGAVDAKSSGQSVPTRAGISEACKGQKLEATDVGITPETITVQVMADVGSQSAPGLFQGAVDAVEAYADHVNATGGIACRELVVEVWDSKLNPEESKNGLIAACATAFAKVGGYSIFNPDVVPMEQCPDKNGATTGIPNIPSLAASSEELCAKTTFSVFPEPTECPKPLGEQDVRSFNGMTKFYLEKYGSLHGMFLAGATTPIAKQGSVPIIEGMRAAGITFDDLVAVQPSAAQSALTPVVQRLKQSGSNFVYNGSADTVMIKMRKEAAAQGLNSVDLWACSLSCYTKNMLAAGPDVEGTYVWLPFLPFEEADTNAEVKAFVDSVGTDKVDAYGAQAWQAAGLFKHAVDAVVKQGGPNSLTRASLLKALANDTKDYDANGWLGTTDEDGLVLCVAQLQVQGGKFVRVSPEKRGTLDCDPKAVVDLRIDPAKLADQIK